MTEKETSRMIFACCIMTAVAIIIAVSMLW